MNLHKFGLPNFGTCDSTLLNKLGSHILNNLKKYLSPICFIVEKRYETEDMSTKDLFHT